MSHVRVFDITGRRKALVRRVQQIAVRTLRTIGEQDAEVEIYIIGETRMRALNARFRKKNESTNVLSFPYQAFPNPERGKNYRGEVYIAPTYSERKGEDVVRIVIHGTLHLFGYDHETNTDASRMKSTEADIHKAFKKERRGL